MTKVSKVLKTLGIASTIAIVSMAGLPNIEASAQGTVSVTTNRGTFQQQSNGQILFLPADGSNPVLVYTGTQRVLAWTRYRSGMITAFSGGGIYNSPDGQNLGGGGRTTRVYGGSQKVRAMIACRGGVFTAFSGSGIYYSPDGHNFGGGGKTTRVYNGTQKVTRMLCEGNAVITSFDGGGTYLSPDGQNLGGGGNTRQIN